MLEAFRDKLEGHSLSDADKDDLMQQLESRLNRVKDIMQAEEHSQDKQLEEALAKRRKKKGDINKALVKLSDKQDSNQQDFNAEMHRLAEIEAEAKKKLDKDIEDSYNQELKDIETAMKKKRNDQLALMEKRLEQLKKKPGKHEDELGDLLNDYGKLVKKVDSEQEDQKLKEQTALSDKLKKRKEEKLKELEKER